MTEVKRDDPESAEGRKAETIKLANNIHHAVEDILRYQRIFGVEFVPPEDEEDESEKPDPELPYEGYIPQLD